MSHSTPDLTSLPSGQEAAGTAHAFPSLEELAALLPQYEIHEVLGVGGMGAVYLARQPALDRWVAIKVLPAAAAENPEDADRFNKEARAMARLSHPHIVAVFEYGQTQAGHLYLAMEYVEGADLHWRTASGEVTPERARIVIAQLCEALQYAHEHGVIHRDIKPANILITPDWQVKVVDFGLAKDLTQQPSPDEAEYGTPDYTAPERWVAGAPVDHRADVYSLGVVIHEILTGKTPRAAGTEAGLGLPEGFAGVLSKCLMHDPLRRYQTAEEVRRALLAATAAVKKKEAEAAAKPSTSRSQAPHPARPMAPRPGSPLFRSRSFAWLGTLGWAVACLAALAGLGWLIWRDHFQGSRVVITPVPEGVATVAATEVAKTEPFPSGPALTAPPPATPANTEPVGTVSAVAAPASWTSNDGVTIEARFVGLSGDNVTLQMIADGKDYTFSLSRLSAESQARAKAAAGQ